MLIILIYQARKEHKQTDVYIKGRKCNKFCDDYEGDNGMVWQINSCELRGNLNIWESKISSFSLAAIY